MKKIYKQVLLFSSIIIFATACEFTAPNKSNDDNKHISSAVTSRGSSQYVRLVRASVNGTQSVTITARRGQPVGAPYDGTLDIIVKKGNRWIIYNMYRDLNTGSPTLYYAAGLLEDDYTFTFYLRLTVFGKCYYDGSSSNPYKIKKKLPTPDGLYDGVIGGKISMASAHINVKQYGPYDVYTLYGYIYVPIHDFLPWNIICDYKTPSGATGSITAYHYDMVGELERWKFSKMISIGYHGDPVPDFNAQVKIINKGFIIDKDDYFGKWFTVNTLGIY